MDAIYARNLPNVGCVFTIDLPRLPVSAIASAESRFAPFSVRWTSSERRPRLSIGGVISIFPARLQFLFSATPIITIEPV
jgi:hypothetical protein